MALPAVTTLPEIEEIIFLGDERVEVKPMTSPPYNWICSLLIESDAGKLYRASGFKIHLPGVTDRAAIVTSGHCTYIKGEYAKKITVQFPGDKAIVVERESLYAAPEYIKDGSLDHDYGLILLPACVDACDDGFGWSTILEDKELENRLVTNCGYPGDKPEGTLWITGGKITESNSSRIFYMNDTMRGQSGSPVYTWYGGYWTVLAVHSYGGYPNSAPRFTTEMITRFLQFMKCYKVKSLRSVAFPDVLVRCDGSHVNHKTRSGTVNCQYNPPRQREKFYIYPVEVSPSLALEGTYKVEIKSAYFDNVFIRLDSKGMSEFAAYGGGEVNCQFSAGPYERFFLKKEENGSYSFESVRFPNCYIRLDGSEVKSRLKGGGGKVNCQWYDAFGPPKSSQLFFHVNEH